MTAFLCHFTERQQWLLRAHFAYEIGRAGKRKLTAQTIVGNVLQGLRRRHWRALSQGEAEGYAALVEGIEAHHKEALQFADLLCGKGDKSAD